MGVARMSPPTPYKGPKVGQEAYGRHRARRRSPGWGFRPAAEHGNAFGSGDA